MNIRFLAAATALLASPITAQAPLELAQNGGFESGDFTGWQIFESAAGNTTIATPGFNSTFAGCIDNQVAASASLIKNANLGAGIVVPGEAITISFDAKGSGAVGGVVFAELFSEISGGGVSSSVILSGAPLTLDPDPNVWRSFVFTGTAGPDVSGGITLQLAAITGAAAGSVSSACFDNVSVTVQRVLASEVVRQAVPVNPGTLLPGQTSGPVIGQVWDPMIQPFVAGSALDVLSLTGASVANLPAQAPLVGTILIDVNAVILNQFVAAAQPFAVAIPNNAVFVGLPLSAQGASLGGTSIELTNALDIVIGY